MVHCTDEDHSSPAALAHVAEHQLKAVAQSVHVRVGVLLQLVALWNHLDRPVLKSCMFACLEAKVKVTGVFGVDAECICRAAGVGLGIGLEPLIY